MIYKILETKKKRKKERGQESITLKVQGTKFKTRWFWRLTQRSAIPKVDPTADNTRVQSKTAPEAGCAESSGDGGSGGCL